MGGANAFIALEYLELGGGSRSDCQAKLGNGLAQVHMHEGTYRHFGFPIEGCCGALEQPNNTEQRNMNAMEFWREFRLGHQLREARNRHPHDTQLQERGAELQKR